MATVDELLEALIDCRECLDRVESYLDTDPWYSLHPRSDRMELRVEVRKILDKTSPLVSAKE